MKIETTTKQIGRLALRVEGDEWVAYYARTTTMDGALRIGSIHIRIVEQRPARKQEFMDLMRRALDDILRDVTGAQPSWQEPVTAKEKQN